MTRALAERRIINTRAPHQATALDKILRAHGAVPLEYPCIEIVPVEDNTAFDASLRLLESGGYAWIVLTSINTVLAVARRLDALGLAFNGGMARVAAIGPATREAARELLGIDADMVPEKFVAESLGGTLPVRRGEKVFLPESAIARPVLAEMLRARGAYVDVVIAYDTGSGHGGVDIPSLLAQGAIDAVTFTSSSTVTNFLERIGREGGSLHRALELCAACIGPVTADAARENGFKNIVVPGEYTLAGMTEALEGYFGSGSFRGEDRS